MRPRGLRDLRHQAVYLFGAVCPARDAGVALVLPSVSAAAMQAMLDELSAAGLWSSYDAILDACCAAWNGLLDEAGRIRSLCSLDWVMPVST